MNKKLTKKQKRTRNFKIGKYLVFAGMIILAISMFIFLPVNSWEESKIFVSLGFTSITLIGLGIRKAIIGKFF